MNQLRCDICGGQIEMQPDKRGLCLNCGTSYSLATMKEMFSGVKVSVTGSDEDVLQWRQLLNRYLAAGDYIEAERIVKKILEAVPLDQQAAEQYEQLQVFKFMDVRNGVLKAYSGTSRVLIMPSIITAIDPEVFAENTYLEEIFLPEGLKVIPHGLFRNCSNLQKVHIPDSVTIVEDEAFAVCSALTEIEIPSSVQIIGESVGYMKGAFHDCHKLKRVVFNCGLKEIGNCTFANTALENVELPDGLETIGYCAFNYCHSLRRVVIPNSVTRIGCVYDRSYSSYPFKECNNLETIVYPQRFDWTLFFGTAYYHKIYSTIEEQRRQWRMAKLCQHCGGTFGFWDGKCKKCGKIRDY